MASPRATSFLRRCAIPSLIIVGAGDHGRVMAGVARAAGLAVAGFLQPDDEGPMAAQVVDGPSVLGSLTDPYAWRSGAEDGAVDFIVALGANRAREAVYRRCIELGMRPVALIHPSVILLDGAQVAPGAQICAGAIIGLAATIGANAIINTAATIDHDNRVEEHAFIGPGAHLAGRVTVERGAHVGIGAIVKEGCTIGAWSYVAAGAVVVSDVPSRTRVAGIPARPMDHPPEDPA